MEEGGREENREVFRIDRKKIKKIFEVRIIDTKPEEEPVDVLDCLVDDILLNTGYNYLMAEKTSNLCRVSIDTMLRYQLREGLNERVKQIVMDTYRMPAHQKKDKITSEFTAGMLEQAVKKVYKNLNKKIYDQQEIIRNYTTEEEQKYRKLEIKYRRMQILKGKETRRCIKRSLKKLRDIVNRFPIKDEQKHGIVDLYRRKIGEESLIERGMRILIENPKQVKEYIEKCGRLSFLVSSACTKEEERNISILLSIERNWEKVVEMETELSSCLNERPLNKLFPMYDLSTEEAEDQIEEEKTFKYFVDEENLRKFLHQERSEEDSLVVSEIEDHLSIFLHNLGVLVNNREIKNPQEKIESIRKVSTLRKASKVFPYTKNLLIKAKDLHIQALQWIFNNIFMAILLIFLPVQIIISIIRSIKEGVQTLSSVYARWTAIKTFLLGISNSAKEGCLKIASYFEGPIDASARVEQAAATATDYAHYYLINPATGIARTVIQRA